MSYRDFIAMNQFGFGFIRLMRERVGLLLQYRRANGLDNEPFRYVEITTIGLDGVE